MAVKKTQRGFALLIAVIFMTVMLSLGLTLGALGYKQEVLASTAVESQYAFYAADAGLECALYYDQQEGSFVYQPPSFPQPSAPSITCAGTSPISSSAVSYPSYWEITYRLSLDNATNNPRCADVTIYKYKYPLPPNNVTTYVFSQGYNVSCTAVGSGANFSSSGLSYHY